MKDDTKAGKRPADDTCRIVSLQAENIKKLTAIQIKPDGSVVAVTGKNGAGKSSIFDAIEWAIEGRKTMPKEPIRRGAEKGKVRLDLGDIVITRTLARRGDDGGEFETGVTVMRKDGSKLPSPQAVLDAFFGAFTFDPGAFLRMKPKEKFEALKPLVPGIDFDEIARAHKRDYDARTDAGREAARLLAHARSIEVPDDTPAEQVDLAALRERRRAAEAANEEIANRARRREDAAREIETALDRAETLRAEAASLEKKAGELQAKLDAAEPLPDPADLEALVNEIETASELNSFVRLRQERDKTLEQHWALDVTYSDLTTAIDLRQIKKHEAIAAAKLPVSGMGFGDDDTLTLGSVPFEQASTGEQLRAALGIGMAMNPKLRDIFIREGSMFDADALKAIGAMAAERGYCVWIERVADAPGVGIFIENGAVREAS